jgi:hypothetical protein
VALLCVHSIWFRTEITRLNGLIAAAASYDDHVSKKRKLSPATENVEEKAAKIETVDSDTDEEPAAKVDSHPDAMQDHHDVAEKPEMAIRLPDVDPAIFGLFLKFIYKDSYPDNVDSRVCSVSKFTVPASPSAHHHHQFTPTPTAALRAAGPSGHMPSLPPTPSATPLRNASMAPPPAPRVAHTDTIPPSIHAWLLAQRLGAMSFMNHGLVHVYSGIGTYFALTPSLMDHVWKETSAKPAESSRQPAKPSTVLHPSPLRKLLMDVLVTYWSYPNSANPNAIILRSLALSPHFSTPLKHAWDALFDAHKDLREDFIHGLQGGSTLLPVHAYFASSGVRADKVMRDMSDAGKGKGRAEGYDQVVVKKEVADNGEEVVEVAAKEAAKGAEKA